MVKEGRDAVTTVCVLSNQGSSPIPHVVIPRFMRGTHRSASGAERNNPLTGKLNHGSREHVAG